MLNRLISVAPMMDCTDRHFRYLVRLITRSTLIYTEMLTCGAVIHGDRKRLLAFSPAEHPLALQLGGSNPQDLVLCARIAEDLGFDEINLNVGCPSARVQSGSIGVCLMKKPFVVADCVAAMQQQVRIPITVKCRIGVDYDDSYSFLCDFIKQIAAAGCRTFILHARKAWLNGLSPKQNRTVPPLCYETVYQLKNDCPELEIIINGGVKTTGDIDLHLRRVDGVMIGREAYSNPFCLAQLDSLYFGKMPVLDLDRLHILIEYMGYAQQQVRQGVPVRLFARHLMGLFQSVKGGKKWRRMLAERCCSSGSTLSDLQSVVNYMGEYAQLAAH